MGIKILSHFAMLLIVLRTTSQTQIKINLEMEKVLAGWYVCVWGNDETSPGPERALTRHQLIFKNFLSGAESV